MNLTISRFVPSLLLCLALGAVVPAAARAQEDSVAQENSAAQADSAATPDTVQAAVDSADVVADAPEPLTRTQEARDEATRAELQAIFDRVPSLEGIEVAVSAGVVRLTGQVPHSQSAERAADLARTRDGVVYVDSEGLSLLATGARVEDIWSRLSAKFHDFLLLLPLFGVALVIVVVFGVMAWAVGRSRPATRFPKMNPFLTALLLRLIQSALVIVGVILALELLDATAIVGAVVGTAGLAGVALGFAFKDIVENYLAGIILSLRQPFAKNDLIEVGGHEGKVVRLTGRETFLMTPDGNHVQIPNATVFREPMVNYTRNPRRRFTVDVDVAAETDLAAALDVGIAVLHAMEGVIDNPPPGGLVVGYGNGTIALRFTGWVDQREAEFCRVRSEALRLIKEALDAAGVDMPSPEYRIALPASTGASTGASTAGVTPPLEGGGGRPGGDPVTPARPVSVPPATGQVGIEGQRDVSVDESLDQQIEEERRRDPQGEDLLE